tara:strand:+ start:1928 stop:2146 length:219 start_codon:yes stop_codon:yes gene_type:complete
MKHYDQYDKFKPGDQVTIPKHLHTKESMDMVSKERVIGVYVRYCGDNCGIINFEGRYEMWSIGWMKPVKKFK